MDIAIEIFLEVYMELMLLLVPEEKRKKRHYVLASVVAILFSFGILALGFWGIYLLWEEKNMLGILPLTFAILCSIAQITAGIVLHVKKKRK